MTNHMQLDDELVEAELAAALVANEEQPLSPILAGKVLAQGKAHVSPVVDIASRRKSTWPMWTGWAAAAAVAIWAVSGGGSDGAPRTDAAPDGLRASLLATSSAVVGWDRAGDPTGQAAEGDVVWSDSAQAGVMRFRGLAANDASKEQYQLWIFDASRDERYPVDGGVFNVSADSGDVLVRIRPSVPVTKATLFVVTVERPGGVVVSDRSRIALLAKRVG
jgi:hypothetical protein